MQKYKWTVTIEGEIDAPSKEIAQAAVISQLSFTVNLGQSLRQTKVEVEPVSAIEIVRDTPPIAFEASIADGRRVQ